MVDLSLAETLTTLGALLGLAGGALSYRAARLSRTVAVSGAATPLDVSLGALFEGRALLPSTGDFVNRDAELNDAMDRIRAGETAIAIEGEEGIGKSATAMELANRLRRREHVPEDLPDLSEHTFLWFPCEGRCPGVEEICSALSRLTGDQSLSAVADREKLNALRIHMSLRKTVLVLDDLRLSDDKDSAKIRSLVEKVPEGSLAIVSLEQPHELQASRVRLAGLELPHVQQLVERQARALGLLSAGEFDGELAKRLREALNGNPGEIDWALSSFNRGYRSLEDHLAAVERGETHQEKAAAQWAELSRRDRTVLSACAFLKGHATVEQLGAACELPAGELGEALEELVAFGHVLPIHSSGAPSAYAASTRIARVALGEMSAAAEATLAARIVEQLKGHFARHPEDAPAATPYVGSLRPVLTHLFDQGNDADLHVLFKASLDILFTLGLFDDRIDLGRLAHDSAERARNHTGAALAAEVISSTHAARGEMDSAREALALGYAAAGRSGAPADRVRQTRCDALIEYRSGRARKALAISAGLDGRAREAGDTEALVNILGMRAAASRYVDDFEASRVAAEECLRVCEEIPWPRGVAYPLRDLAEVAVHEGRFDRAEERLARARVIASENQDKRQMARIALTEARLRLLAGEPGAAGKAAEQAQSEAARLGLAPEVTEAQAIYDAAGRARAVPPLRLYYQWRRPRRLTRAPT
jgi:hypothetical protein